MNTQNYRRLACAAAFALMAGATGAAVAAVSITKADYAATKERISVDYRADREACQQSSGNAKDICLAQAHGKERVALADLEYNYTGKTSDAIAMRKARAEAEYAVAIERCDDKAGVEKDVCRTEAKSARTKSLANTAMNQKVGEARLDAAEEKNDADYRVAIEKCQSLAAEAKDSCTNSAKIQFHKT